MKDVDIYAAADKAIQNLNRDMVRSFGHLKTSKADELHIIREVTALYQELRQKARRRYQEVAFEAFLLAMFLCGTDGMEAQKKAEKTIDAGWVDAFLADVDPVVKYRFDTETERKAQRLAEALVAAAEAEGAGTKGKPTTWSAAEIDKAMKDWSRQVGQGAIDVTDAAVMEAYEAAGIENVRWITERDGRECSECRRRDQKVYPLDAVPVKPHRGCRCRTVPERTEGS